MPANTTAPPVLELRVALTTGSFERLVSFYREGLGLEPSRVWPEDQGRALVLDLGRATLEVFDEKQANTVDQYRSWQPCQWPCPFRPAGARP